MHTVGGVWGYNKEHPNPPGKFSKKMVKNAIKPKIEVPLAIWVLAKN
jgi:hypothetical protein